jgi:RHS repeat-associated protein
VGAGESDRLSKRWGTDSTYIGVEKYYIHTDHLNTPRRISRASDNQIVWRWDNDPFGRHTANEDPDGDSQLFTFALRYPGQYYDEETGLHYNYFRDYDPATGRYIESDPIGLAAGLNTYGYVGGNPVRYADPSGLLLPALALPFVAGGSSAGFWTTLAGITGLALLAGPSAELNEAPPESKEWIDDPQAQVEYDYYKAQCKGPLPPSGDKCQDLRNLQQQAQMCAELRQQWDDRWMPGKHELEILKELQRAQKYRRLAEQCEQQKKTV